MKKTIVTALIVLQLFALAACQNKNGNGQEKANIDLSSYPIDTNVTLKYYRPLSANISGFVENYSETPLAKEIVKRTGVNIEYLHPAVGQERETISLMISSGGLPDIVENDWIGFSGGPVKAMNEKIIVNLNDYKQYAPALFKMFSEIPEYDKASKTDDGRYYGFPLILGSNKLLLATGPAIRIDWLEELGLEIPETIDEWEYVLTAFKEKKDATAPFSFNYSNIYAVVNMFEANFDMYIEDDVVKYGAAQPEFKNALTILHNWFEKGLLDKNIVSVDTKLIDSQILKGKTGATVTSGGAGIGQYMKNQSVSDSKFDLTGIKYPTFAKGATNYCLPLSVPISGGGTAAVTAKSKNPELAAKVLDYFYTEEGHILGNFGIEGLTYTMVDGYPQYSDIILNNPDGLTISQALGMHVKAGSGSAFVMDERYIEQYYDLPQQKKALDAWITGVDIALKRIVPPISPTTEEATEYANIMTEVNKYRSQMVIKFITGIEPISKFDDYVDTLNKYGLERAMQIRTDAVKRYNAR